MRKTIPRNYKICTLDKHLDCAQCEIARLVDCSRHQPEKMVKYYKVLGAYIIPGFLIVSFSSYLLGIWWLLPAYIFYWIFYQVAGELVIRCRHCPFWDEANHKLDCRINCRVPKLQWLIPPSLRRYNPAPLKLWEKMVVQILSILTILIPLALSTINLVLFFKQGELISVPACMMGFLTASQIFTGVYFIQYLTQKLCTTCVHFSCPNNRQPFHVIEKYLKKNDLILQAWKKDLEHYSTKRK